MYVVRFSLAHLPGVSITLVFDTIPTIDEVYERLVLKGILPADEAFTEISAIAGSNTFHVFSESNPEVVYKGTLVYNSPMLEEGKRTYLLKIRVKNSGGKLIPGTLVSVIPEKSFTNIMAVPKSAVLLEKMKTVWVLAHDNTFEQRMVKTGAENNDWVEITSGLKPGEIVVIDGAYLISSEFTLKSGAGQRHDH